MSYSGMLATLRYLMAIYTVVSALPPCHPTETTTIAEQLSALDSCIHCGLCLPACPTYRVTGSEAESPRGRLYLMKGMLEGDERMTPEAIQPHIDQCLGCVACQTACPSGVEYGSLLETTRKTLLDTDASFGFKLKRWFRRTMYRWVLPNRGLVRAGTATLKLAETMGLFKLASSGLNPVPALRRLARMQPNIAALHATVEKNSAWQAYQQALNTGGIITRRGAAPSDLPMVALFAGCVMDAWFARVHAASITALVANGYAVWVPNSQTCCGALAHHAGEMDIAHTLEARNTHIFNTKNLTAVVVNAAGCGSTMANWQVPTTDILALLAKQPLTPMESSHQPSNKKPLRVAYHAACHLHHAQGVQQQPYTVLEQLPNVAMVPLKDADLCCGSAGVYNVANPALADAILSEKLATLNPADVDVLATANPGCVLQWQAGLKAKGVDFPVVHPVELLAQGYGTVAMQVHPFTEGDTRV